MTDKPLITHERLLQVLNYDSETGVFTWAKQSLRKRMSEGDMAGARNGFGYRQIVVDGRLYLAHRLAWFYMNGEWPNGNIDHANGDPSDNRICNLRIATTSQNAANKRKPSNNTSGYKGVFCEPKTGRYRARIRVENKIIHIGMFSTKEDASAAYIAAAEKFFGEFAKAG